MAATGQSMDKLPDSDKRALCKYGAQCYRKNSAHLRQYHHPKQSEGQDPSEQDGMDSPPPKKRKTELEVEDKGNAMESSPVEKEAESCDTTALKKDVENGEQKASTSAGSDLSVDDGSDDEVNNSNVETTQEAEEVEADLLPPASPEDVKANIKQKFLVDMPEDFYQLWEFCKSAKPKDPSNCFKVVLGLQLVGPYDILAGKHKHLKGKNCKGRLPNYLIHWRYYYDPPEFQTVVRGDDSSQFHLGYFRDVPTDPPVFVGANSAKEGCTIVPRGDNIFAAINSYLCDSLKTPKLSGKIKTAARKLQTDLTKWAEDHDICLDLKTKSMKERDRKIVCKTFHGAGIVVKLDRNEVGYRPVPETPAALKKIFKKIKESKSEDERDKLFEPLQELITLIQFANDECDYGEGLELGLDLFCFGGDVFHSTIQLLLPLAYQLLQHPQFSQIITDHLKHRKMDVSSETLNELE